ncbi:hypothetical protein, partial [Escherichia coli]|uniref:hypothetical protein n=2 Tax=Enterobacterales TaxID=91347 RepID=UPI001952ECA6
PIVKLWKEVLVLIYYVFSVSLALIRGRLKLSTLILVVIAPAFVLTVYIITSLGDDLTLVMYQIKNDFIPFFFVLG